MAKDNIAYPVGLEMLWKHFDETVTLDTNLYAVLLADTYDPETDQDADDVEGGATTANGMASHLWDGKHTTNVDNTTDNAIVTSSFTYARTSTQFALKFANIEFGTIDSSAATLTAKYIGLFVEESGTDGDNVRYPIACLRCGDVTHNETFTYVTDTTGVVLWKC